ncbi:MAG: carboxypeptidase regulatory-like domain-containing protein [Acidobacteria bacterium]|nr:carboxypeptidase regulatory-like domain-containing protein [Acidobacteriota bacterium]
MPKDVDDPKAKCPVGSLEVEVVAVNDTDPEPQRIPVAGASTKVNGPTKPAGAKTDEAGTRKYPGLDPGAYTVSVRLEGALLERFDGDPQPPDQTKTVKSAENQHYLFEVPYHWVEYKVHDGKNHPLPNVPYKLNHSKTGKSPVVWTKLEEGKTKPDGRIYRKPTPKGAYELVIKAVSNPKWGAGEAVADEAIQMSATVTGFDPGADATFQILDAVSLGRTIDTVATKVGGRVEEGYMKASWTPKDKILRGNLISSKAVFRAKVGSEEVLSAPLPVFKKEEVSCLDQDGENVDIAIKFHLSDGDKAYAITNEGSGNARIPWGRTVVRVELLRVDYTRLKFEAGGPLRLCLLPG